MVVNSIRLNNFRSYERLAFSPENGINVIAGENAAGKTTLLEAVFLCAYGRSHRTFKSAEMIKSGEQTAYVSITVADSDGDESVIAAKLFQSGSVDFLINDVKITRIGELVGYLKTVMFSPESLLLIKGAPAERRRFMDMCLSQLSKSYFTRLQQYNHVLKQKNTLLKSESVQAGQKDTAAYIDVWDDKLSELGAYISFARKNLLDRLLPRFSEMYSTLSDDKESIALKYVPDIELPYDSVSEGKKLYLDRLIASRDEFIRCKSTYNGIHRDDFLVTTDGMNSKSFASQGQQRTAALALKLAETSLMETLSDARPIVLLDDVFSELDESRCKRVFDALSGCQCFITCAQESLISNLEGDFELFFCEDGNVFEG